MTRQASAAALLGSVAAWVSALIPRALVLISDQASQPLLVLMDVYYHTPRKDACHYRWHMCRSLRGLLFRWEELIRDLAVVCARWELGTHGLGWRWELDIDDSAGGISHICRSSLGLMISQRSVVCISRPYLPSLHRTHGADQSASSWHTCGRLPRRNTCLQSDLLGR